jgi:hypothetical protein
MIEQQISEKFKIYRADSIDRTLNSVKLKKTHKINEMERKKTTGFPICHEGDGN